MTQTLKIEDVTPPKTEETAQESPTTVDSLDSVELSIEEQAKLQGWTPLEEYVAKGKDKVTWKDAKRFIEDGVLYHKNKKLNDELKALKLAFNKQAEYLTKLDERAYQRAKAELEAAKQQLLSDENASAYAYHQLAESEKALESQKVSYEPQKFNIEDEVIEAAAEIKATPMWKKFELMNGNWYHDQSKTGEFLRSEAQRILVEYAEQGAHNSDQELQYLHKEIRKQHGDLIARYQQNKNEKSAVLPLNTAGAKNAKTLQVNMSGDIQSQIAGLTPAQQGAIMHLHNAGHPYKELLQSYKDSNKLK